MDFFLLNEAVLSAKTILPKISCKCTLCHTVHLTSADYLVPENQEFCFTPTKTIVGLVKKYKVSLAACFEDEDLQRYVWSQFCTFYL